MVKVSTYERPGQTIEKHSLAVVLFCHDKHLICVNDSIDDCTVGAVFAMKCFEHRPMTTGKMWSISVSLSLTFD